MNKRNINVQKVQCFPLQSLQKFVQNEGNCKKRIIPKYILSSKVVIKNHSKSLYYNNGLRHEALKQINRTGIDIKNQNIAQQTLNQQLLGAERKKPATTQYRSSRNTYNKIINIDTKNNKISLRSSSNYSKLISIAGIPMNQEQTKLRLQNHLQTNQNIRKDKKKQIQKENEKLAKRLNSQHSEYSTKKLLQAYESQEKISKRLTESKMSKRSNRSIDNRSVYSQNSSRASVRSNQSKNSRTSSLKSTSRANSSKSSTKNQGYGRFQSKLQNQKKVKIIQHNINKINENQINKFKNLFANSFSTAHNSGVKNQNQNQNIHLHSYHQRLLKNNPYVDIEILSQKSEKSQKSSKKNKESYELNYYSTNTSNRKLQQINYEFQANKDQFKVIKKSSALPSSDGILHRIAQQMYNNNSKSDGMKLVSEKKLKLKKKTATSIGIALNNERSINLVKDERQMKVVNNERTGSKVGQKGMSDQGVLKRVGQKGKQRMEINVKSSKRNRLIKNELRYPLFPTNQIFGKI